MVRFGGIYWLVRSVYKFENKVFAIPRYLDVDPELKPIKEADLSIEVAKKLFPEHVHYVECFGREVPLIPIEKFEKVFDPRRFRPGDSQISHAAYSLVETIRKEIGVANVGVTGGLLLGRKTNDIDIVVYGEREAYEVYRYLAEKNFLEHYTLEESFKLINERKECCFNYTLLQRESEKVLQGKFKGFDVYIRLIPVYPELPLECKRKVKKLGDMVIEGKCSNDEHGMLYPCSYEIVTENNNIKRISSDRGRFCELLKKSEKFIAKGEIEIVYENSTSYEQLYLWKQEHFLIPLTSSPP